MILVVTPFHLPFSFSGSKLAICARNLNERHCLLTLSFFMLNSTYLLIHNFFTFIDIFVFMVLTPRLTFQPQTLFLQVLHPPKIPLKSQVNHTSTPSISSSVNSPSIHQVHFKSLVTTTPIVTSLLSCSKHFHRNPPKTSHLAKSVVLRLSVHVSLFF